ncbi:hypothetical protein G1C96_0290 [Bifidobacterium sp. DSM 109958]|uniref:DUF881 domain-containing protein n=1 Tax=Bifidobacterium moraviense TaxID=2675323 RepID=A0A7Y0F0F0_9BIFI|nr:DUF881 domain-containing protein [Bifidobacterium sp. DSM 109958]NMM99712.1 hypothetical protein [Bifidobacterium sp. DSM 109958]
MSGTDGNEPIPESIPVPGSFTPRRRRTTFSAGALGLTRQYAEGPMGIRTQNATRRRRLADDSLRLIDDLTNRPMDSLYADSLLDQRPRSAFTVWATRVIVFVICVAVGVAGSVVVQRLHADPRKQQRDWYISRIEEVSQRSDALTKDVSDLRGQIDALSDQVGADTVDPTQLRDEMTIGAVAVQGPGISVTLANPLAAKSDDASSSSQLRVITDGDLQWYVSQLWGAGAEAIAVNGNRLGIQSAIRKAGGTILVDLTKIESPYVIEAIGDGDALRAAVDVGGGEGRNAVLEQAGIYPKISSQKTITLKAAEPKNLSYARSVD